MEYNILTNNATCHQMIADTVPLALVYYSHIPTALIALFIGLFVFLKNPKALINKLLLGLTLTFSLWLLLDLIVWVMNYNTLLTMLAWSPLGLINVLFFILGLYFVYVFVNKKDISFVNKVIFGLLLLPVIVMAPTKFNLPGFTMMSCESIESEGFLNYIFYIEIIIASWIVVVSSLKFLKSDKVVKQQILLLSVGIILFLLLFFGAGYIAIQTENYDYELYGHFGMTIFMGFLAYLIVKFKAFHIKVLATQALVVALVILIGSQYFFVQSTTSLVLVGVTFILSLVFGYILIKSVKQEVERKEQLQTMADKLAVANDQLRKLDNAKTEFISIASHQLRTPLTSIKGFLSLIIEGSYGEINDKVKDALVKVYASSERLIQLVEDLLNVSRIESGRMQFTFEQGNVGTMMKELYENFLLVAKGKKLYLDLKLPENGLPEITYDPSKIREVISNFTDNALKYTEKGGVTMKAEETPDKTIKITISDTGIGVPADEMQYLFKKFSRGKDTGRLHASGTGLGLYVGKNIVDAHNGKVWIESDGEGMGSRFIIELPITQPEA